MGNPGIADPYWYEWYVGLKYVIEMLNPDSGIECVVFQCESYDVIDDVVVEYKDGNRQICYQIKHKIETTISSKNLTFGNLLEKKNNKKSLIHALYSGWSKAMATTGKCITPILYTNRGISNRRTNRIVDKKEYKAYPIDVFFTLIREVFEKSSDYDNLNSNDSDLLAQWNELCSDLEETDISNVVLFVKDFSIRSNEYSLLELRNELISLLASQFSCSSAIAEELFDKLRSSLDIWTTTMRKDERVTIEDVYSAIGTENDIDESQHRLIPPYPFFESRQAFCKELELKIKSTDKKVVFVSGDPGSGKTSTISYLQSSSELFLLRYHTFRPISPEQKFYNFDEGMSSSEKLWGTFLIQLRQKFKGKLAEYQVPVNNKLLTVDMMRSHVSRLLGVLGQNAIKHNTRVFICIDGIDHAARAKSNVSFLSSLLLPNEIPEGVCFVIVGQPSSLYQDQYPSWLVSGDDIERIDMPKLCVGDIKQLISVHIPQMEDNAESIATVVYQYTQGNNLSTVFAIEEIKNTKSLDECIEILKNSGISEDIQQYYFYIWRYMKSEIVGMGLSILFPESIVACPILLMNGRVNTHILSRALPYDLNESDWNLILKRLYPLIIPCNKDGEYALFHNDFRVFLMGVIDQYKERYEEIALALAEDILNNDEGLLTYISGIPLLQCANKNELIPKYFTPGFIINALAEGISKQRLDNYAYLSYEATCINEDIEGYINTYLAIKTLHQHERYFEYYDREYVSNDYSELSSIDILEIRTLPLLKENLDEYDKVLSLCFKLYTTGTNNSINRALSVYEKWFGSVNFYSFVPLCQDDVSEDEYWKLRTHEVGVFLQQWGQTAAQLKRSLPQVGNLTTNIEEYAVSIFGEAYFNKCIEQKEFSLANDSIIKGYVSDYAFSEKIEEIFYNGLTNEFSQFLIGLDADKDKQSKKFFAMVMLASIDNSVMFEKATLDSDSPTNHIYDESSFEIILKSFLLGYIERVQDDAVICSHAIVFCSNLEESKKEINQISNLVRFACLLGKYYWSHTDAIPPTLNRYVNWFLTTKLWRPFDYRKVCRFLLFILLKSPLCEKLSNVDDLICNLKFYLFEIDNLGMYYKTCILDYLKKHKRLDIIREYILSLYGNKCEKISTMENKVDLHNNFCVYGELVEPQLMKDFTMKLKWDVVGYMGNDEYALQGPLDCFDVMSTQNPSVWSSSGYNLLCQSLIADLSSNRCSSDIRDSLVKSAVNCGLEDFWEIHFWDDDFKYDTSLIYNSIFTFIKRAETETDLKILWLLNCGINSWYTQDERYGSQSVYNECCNRAQHIGVDFKAIVESITPQWMTIIENQLSKEKTLTINNQKSSLNEKSKDIEAIQKEYYSCTIEELLSILPIIPTLSYQKERYKMIIERLISDDSLTSENAHLILDSACSYLGDKQWMWERVDIVIIPLLNALKEEAFWSLAKTISDHLSEYNYQTSARNMQYLLKMYHEFITSDMEQLFKKELLTQNLWVTGNNHISVDFNFEPQEPNFLVPTSLSEVTLYILLEQIETHNARKIEMAILILYCLGKQFADIIKIIAQNWFTLSEFQKEMVSIVVIKWAIDGVDLTELCNTLIIDYDSCNLLSKKYYLHSLLCLLNVKGMDSDKISCDADSDEYTLPTNGYIIKDGMYENFLVEVEANSDYLANDLRRYISKYPTNKTIVRDQYGEHCDISIPTLNYMVEKALYGEEKDGYFNMVSLFNKKSNLLISEDPFILTEMPIVFYDDCFSDLDNFNSETIIRKIDFKQIVRKRTSEQYELLAACMWLPYNYKEGVIYNEVSIIESLFNSYHNNEFSWCLGNLGLLFKEGILNENIRTNVNYGGVPLFNRIGGSMRFAYGNSKFSPSSIWYDILKCKPSETTPYVWVDENNKDVLFFEHLVSPIREVRSEFYIRQPNVFRWYCDANWLKDKLDCLKLKIRYISSIEDMSDLVEE